MRHGVEVACRLHYDRTKASLFRVTKNPDFLTLLRTLEIRQLSVSELYPICDIWSVYTEYDNCSFCSSISQARQIR